MMFLVKGELYHTGTWDLWFKYAHGWLPVAPVKVACRHPDVVEAARRACQRREKGTGEDVLANQHLFNVYVHVGMNNQDFKGGLFCARVHDLLGCNASTATCCARVYPSLASV